MVKSHEILFFKRHKGKILIFLLSHLPKVQIYLMDKFDDIIALHLQTDISRIHPAELHELVHQPEQSSCSSAGSCNCSARLRQILRLTDIRDGILNDGERCAELVGDMRKEVQLEFREL